MELALRDPRLSKRDPQIDAVPEAVRTILGHRMLGLDPPDHTRMRRSPEGQAGRTVSISVAASGP